MHLQGGIRAVEQGNSAALWEATEMLTVPPGPPRLKGALLFSLENKEQTIILLVVPWLLMVGIYHAILCQNDGKLESNTELQEDEINGTRVDNLTLASINTDFAFCLY